MKLLIEQPFKICPITEAWNGQNEYIADYRTVMKKKEIARIPFAYASPQINYRKSIVEYLKQYSSDKRLTHTCLHLAVYLLDIFMDNHGILPSKLHLVANACLLLSAKYEEQSSNIPKIQELNSAAKCNYSIDDYKMVEVLILKFFGWYLALPTPANYVHYFMQFSINQEDLNKSGKNCRTLFYDMDDYIRIYLDKVIEDVHFMHQYKPSILAGAIISAAREQLGLQCWTEELEEFTHLSKENILKATKALLK